MRPLPVLLSLALAASMAATPNSGPSTDGTGSDNMSHVANVQWDDTLRAAAGRTIDTQGGTDVEIVTMPVDGVERDIAFAGTYNNGLQVIDVTDPTSPVHLTTYECEVLQGDVQVFQRDDRWYLLYAADSGYSHVESACHTDARLDVTNGAIIIDVTDPTNPVTVGMAEIPGGSHNMTVHPSGMFLYNSSSDATGKIDVISLADLKSPEIVFTLPTDGEDAHDITFTADGSRAYAANVNHSMIINTEDPAAPVAIATINDPAVTLHHQIDPVTVGDRTFAIINDELAGAGGNEFCPGGGLHVWDVTDEANPSKVGAWFAPDLTVRDGADTGLGGTVTCTSHVFRIYPEQQKLVIAWFGAGIRVIDLAGLADDVVTAGAGVAGSFAGTSGMVEVGYYRFPEDSDAWSAKVHRWDEDGSAYIFADDQTRGFDVYRYDAGGAESPQPGLWVSPDQALGRLLTLRASGFVPNLAPICRL